MLRPALALIALAAAAAPLSAQRAAAPGDVDSPESIVRALYETVIRAPGAAYQWDRMRTLFLPTARMIPNTEQTGGAFRVLTVEEFITWIDGATPIGGPQDKGFAEEQIAATVARYGDIAHVFSTYQKHLYDDPEILGHGINSIQLIRHDGRWWITQIIWDEENGAGPIPPEYRQGQGQG